ncbi:MAG TPA: phosphoglucosamine mutase [Gaiellaceae bacterium]|jgi:phosphoglucosamine mutase|nr:phosphoglucosamine mutase [Gaiellaceae bacterium]
MRRYFGTDGVRGIVGHDLTSALVERLGRAVTLWMGGGAVLIGRDTRASGRELERAFASGVASAGGNAMLAGVLPTPAVALLALDLGAVITASHNPPEYNGVKLFDGDGQKLPDEAEEEIEALLGESPRNADAGEIDNLDVVHGSYVDHVIERFGEDLEELRIGVDCANGAYAGIAPAAFERLGARVTPIGDSPDGNNINVDCGATDLRALQKLVVDESLDLGVAFDGDGDRMLAVDERGEAVDGDQILAALALELDVDMVAVTTMANLGLHRLMEERGIRVVTTDVGDRYVLEALRREGGVLGGEQSGHLIYLDGHVTGDGLVAALLLCKALRGRRLSETVAVMDRFPQVMENIRVTDKELTPAIRERVEETNAQLAGRGRVLVRPSGTEPVVRVLAEAQNEEEARNLCGTIASLVSTELG